MLVQQVRPKQPLTSARTNQLAEKIYIDESKCFQNSTQIE